MQNYFWSKQPTGTTCGSGANEKQCFGGQCKNVLVDHGGENHTMVFFSNFIIIFMILKKIVKLCFSRETVCSVILTFV